MLLKVILSHRDWDWKARRDVVKVIELFSNIVEKVTGTRPVTKGNSPLRKVANQLVSKARAKSSKTGNFLSEEELQDKEHSWLSARDISGIEWKESDSETKEGSEMEKQEARSEDESRREDEPVREKESDGGVVWQVCASDPESSPWSWSFCCSCFPFIHGCAVLFSFFSSCFCSCSCSRTNFCS